MGMISGASVGRGLTQVDVVLGRRSAVAELAAEGCAVA
jgi:hypothetical protein